MKLLTTAILLLVSQGLFALSIQENNIQIPKITYDGLKAQGINDSVEVNTKNSLRKILKDPEMARKLKDPTEVDSQTYSLVREIEAESKNANLRLMKNKARKIIFDFAKENWEQISKSTINAYGASDFKEFSAFLAADLNEKLYFTYVSADELRLEMDWAKVRLKPSQNLAQVIMQKDYLADENELTQQAIRVRAKPGTSGIKKADTAGSSRFGAPGKKKKSGWFN